LQNRLLACDTGGHGKADENPFQFCFRNGHLAADVELDLPALESATHQQAVVRRHFLLRSNPCGGAQGILGLPQKKQLISGKV
jgi:hypothetical protein